MRVYHRSYRANGTDRNFIQPRSGLCVVWRIRFSGFHPELFGFNPLRDCFDCRLTIDDLRMKYYVALTGLEVWSA